MISVLIKFRVILLSKEFIYPHGLHKVMLGKLRKNLIITLISISIILAILVPVAISQSQTVSNIVIVPNGIFPFNIPTTGALATFTIYVINENPTSESVPVYLNGNQYTTVTLSPYGYTTVTLSLPPGKNVIIVGGESLTLNVTKVSTIVTGNALLNKTSSPLIIVGKPGYNYEVNLTIYNVKNFNTSIESYTDSSIFYTNMYYLYSFPINLEIPFENSTFLLFKVPSYVPQGLYYFFNYIEFYNTTNYKQILGYIPFLILINVSYGLNGNIVTSNTYTSNGITVSFMTSSNYTYILAKYPFSFKDKVIFTIIPISSPSSKFTAILSNYSISIPYPGGFSTTAEYYGSNNVEFAYTNSWIEIKVPEQYTTNQYQINVTYVTPTGVVSTGLIPQITSTSTTSTTTTSITTTSSTSSSSTSSTTSSTITTSSSSSTSTTSSTTTTTSTSTTSSSSSTSSSTSSTFTSSTSSTTSLITTTTTHPISTQLVLGILIVVLAIVIIAIVLLRRR